MSYLYFITGMITTYGLQLLFCQTKKTNIEKVKNTLLAFALYTVFPEKLDDGFRRYDGSKLPRYYDNSLSEAMMRYYFYEKITDEKRKAIDNFVDINVFTKQECIVFLNRFFNKQAHRTGSETC